MCGENVVGPDGRPYALQRGADIGRLISVRGLDGQNLEWPRQNVNDALRIALGAFWAGWRVVLGRRNSGSEPIYELPIE